MISYLYFGFSFFFFFNDTATTEIYTLSLHDALPIYMRSTRTASKCPMGNVPVGPAKLDRKSTRLNSSHLVISYAVFCLKKKKKPQLQCVTQRSHAACSRLSAGAFSCSITAVYRVFDV